jgi:hypothetical protein
MVPTLLNRISIYPASGFFILTQFLIEIRRGFNWKDEVCYVSINDPNKTSQVSEICEVSDIKKDAHGVLNMVPILKNTSLQLPQQQP